MATLTVQEIISTGSGLNVTYAAASTADEFANDGNTFLHIKNTNGSTRTLTITAQGTSIQKEGYGTVTVADSVYTIAATTGDHMIGPFPITRFNTVNNRVAYTLNAATGVTVAAVKMADAH